MKWLIKAYKQFNDKLWMFILGGLITSIFCYITFTHYGRADSNNNIISHLENTLWDFKFLFRGANTTPTKVGILAIDEKSIQQFGRWPFSRRYYRQALKNLRNLGVKWIGFDVAFSEPENTRLVDVKDDINQLKSLQGKDLVTLVNKLSNTSRRSLGDYELSLGIKEFQNIVLGYFYMQSKSEVEKAGRKLIPFKGIDNLVESEIEAVIFPGDLDYTNYSPLFHASGLVGNIDLVAKSTPHHAFFSNEADYDAIVRWVTIVKILDNKLMPSLSLKLAAESIDRDILVVFDEQRIESIELVSRDDESDSIKIPIDPMGSGRVLANHRGPRGSFKHFSLADAYNNSFSKEQKKYLLGSTLLMGMTAIGINDQRPNPFDPTLDGIENHAALVDNIVNHNFMSRPKEIFVIELIILFIIGLLFTPIMIFSSAAFSGFFVILFLVGYYFFDKYYWFNNGVWAYIGLPILEIVILFITITLYKYIVEEKEKRKVKGAFSHYLSSEVISQVLADPSALKLGGEKRQLTVFFSDVRNFTSISEGLSPEQLCQFMNDYFSPMTGIILRSKGVLDKYIGDAIMAFWGAPISLPNHADIAATVSIEMLYALDNLQKKFKKSGFPHCDIGIGLNTGVVSVGNMGSNDRFCYTVMGDAVNLASRLEGLTKEYGIKIVVSENTVKDLKQPHYFRELDDIRVKGKKKPVKIYELMRPDYLSQPGKIIELKELFVEMRQHYKKQQWKNAIKILNECLKINPKDGPSKLYMQRIQQLSDQTRIENWDGVYTFTHK